MYAFLDNKVPQKSKFSKNIFNKIWSPSPIFFKGKQIGKIRPIYNTEKWLWKQEFWDVRGGRSKFWKSDGDTI